MCEFWKLFEIIFKLMFRILIVLMTVFMVACSSDDAAKTALIATDEATSVADGDIADYIEAVDAVAIPVSDSLLISHVVDVKQHGEDLYLLCSNNPFGMDGTILKLGADGSYKGSLTHRGEGPGELRPFSLIAFDVNDKGLYVSDSQKIMQYDHDGNYLSTIIKGRNILSFRTDGERLVAALGDDSLLCHAFDMRGEEIAAAMPRTTLGAVGGINSMLKLADGRMLYHVASANDGMLFDPADASFSPLDITEIPDAQTAAAYEATVKRDPKFGVMVGEDAGVLVNALTVSGDDMILGTNRPEGADAALWLSKNGAVTRIASGDGLADTATGGAVFYPAGSSVGDGVWVYPVNAEGLLDVVAEKEVASRLRDVASGLAADDNPVLVFYKLKGNSKSK